MRLDLETEVRFPTGERAGVIKRVILDQNSQVTGIVLSTDELISRDVVVPLYGLREDPGGVITLIEEVADLDRLESYEEDRVPAVPDSWSMSRDPAPGGDVFPEMMYQPIVPMAEVENLPEGVVGVAQGTEIWCLDGEWGVIDEVLVDDDGHAYAFVGRPHAKDQFDRIIPRELAQEVQQDHVVLACTLADLPTYTQETVIEHEEPELG